MTCNTDREVAATIATKPSVLLVEDEFLLRVFFADHLREAGFIVIEAFNGDEAMALLKGGVGVDLVFTDVRMPGSIDGIGLLRFVLEDRPGTPVIVTSGHFEPALAEESGALMFLPKPCDLDVVVHALKAALGSAA
jgi:DNA-binding NtrC family response regulator